MTIFNHRNFPHPILIPDGLDYRPGFEFKCEKNNMREDQENHRFVVAVQYKLNEPTLTEMIRKGIANFTTTLACQAGRSRESHSTPQEQQEISLDARRYHGLIELQSFITAAQDIPDFHSPSWTTELTQFLTNGTQVPEGAILAISDPGEFRTDEADPIQSCVVITPSDHIQEGQFEINLDDQLIQIRVNTRDKHRIERTRHGERGTYLWPSMYLAAIERSIREHLQEEHQDKQWTLTIRDQLEQAGISTENQDEFLARTLVYAQQLLENPMKRLIEEEDEEE